MYHKTREGEKILIQDMDNNHLINTMKFIERKAAEGLTVRYGGGSHDDFYYDEDHYIGEDALKYMNFYAYKNEAYKRNLI